MIEPMPSPEQHALAAPDKAHIETLLSHARVPITAWEALYAASRTSNPRKDAAPVRDEQSNQVTGTAAGPSGRRPTPLDDFSGSTPRSGIPKTKQQKPSARENTSKKFESMLRHAGMLSFLAQHEVPPTDPGCRDLASKAEQAGWHCPVTLIPTPDFHCTFAEASPCVTSAAPGGWRASTLVADSTRSGQTDRARTRQGAHGPLHGTSEQLDPQRAAYSLADDVVLVPLLAESVGDGAESIAMAIPRAEGKRTMSAEVRK
jgi:hypothetical protein